MGLLFYFRKKKILYYLSHVYFFLCLHLFVFVMCVRTFVSFHDLDLGVMFMQLSLLGTITCSGYVLFLLLLQCERLAGQYTSLVCVCFCLCVYTISLISMVISVVFWLQAWMFCVCVRACIFINSTYHTVISPPKFCPQKVSNQQTL
jgi:hypothetical protein